MSNKDNEKRKVKVRWWHIVLIAFFVVLFLFLAYWQWTRFRSGSGTFQNLGYAFQWPLFAVFVVFAYKAALGYENERLAAQEEGEELGADAAPNAAPQSKAPRAPKETSIDEDFLPARPRIDVEAFNALNQQRRQRGTEEDR